MAGSLPTCRRAALQFLEQGRWSDATWGLLSIIPHGLPAASSSVNPSKSTSPSSQISGDEGRVDENIATWPLTDQLKMLSMMARADKSLRQRRHDSSPAEASSYSNEPLVARLAECILNKSISNKDSFSSKDVAGRQINTGVIRDLHVLRTNFGGGSAGGGKIMRMIESLCDRDALWLGIQGGGFLNVAAVKSLAQGKVTREMAGGLAYLPEEYAIRGLIHWAKHVDWNHQYGVRFAIRRALLQSRGCFGALSLQDLLILKKLDRFTSGGGGKYDDSRCRSSSVEKEVVRGINACLHTRPPPGS